MKQTVSYCNNRGNAIFIEELECIFNKDTVIVCIGTDKCIGDSLGPLVGTMLESKIKNKVYGTLEKPIHGLNLNKRLDEIVAEHGYENIIAIDAALGEASKVGDIIFRNEPINPGKGVGKKLRSIGENSIVGIVDGSFSTEIFINRPIRLNFIYEMATKITNLILAASI